MKTRILSGAVLTLITILSCYFGGPLLLTITLMISLCGMMELYRIVKVNKSLLGIVGYLTAVVYYVMLFLDRQDLGLPVVIGGFMIIMAVYVLSYPKYNSEQVTMTFFAIVYVAVTLSYIYQVREYKDGIYIVWLIYICSWINDTCAYFSGVTFGKHKMSPKLSPKKSIEGLIGGVVGTSIIGAVYGAVISDKIPEVQNAVLLFAIVAAIGAVISVVGDLSASAIKRNHNIKDYGKLIPGHGGIMDRYDSVIFTAPIVYYLVIILNKVL